MLKEKLKPVLLLFIVVPLAVIIWYSPVLFKEHSTLISRDALLLARNYAQFGVFGIEDDLNIVVSPPLVKENANPSISGNKLTALIYGELFKVFGLPQYENLIFFPAVILGLSLLFFTLTVYLSFNFRTALLFSFIYILSPFFWQSTLYNFGTYEFALLFLSLFFLFFSLGKKNIFRFKYLFLILAGIFLALAGLAKEAMFLLAPVLLLFLFFQKQRVYLLAVFVPFIVLVSLFWLPGMLFGENTYSFFLGGKTGELRKDFLDYGFYSHLFPDPYTYHFGREEFLKGYEAELLFSETDFFQKIEMAKEIDFLGFKKPDLFSRFKIGVALLMRHLSRFLSIEDIGGPFIFILFIFGFIYLYQKNKYLFRFFVFWIIFAIFTISFIVMGRRTHLMDFGWAIPLLVALGTIFLVQILTAHFKLGERGKKIIMFFLPFLVLYNLILSDHVLWGREYDSETPLMASVYAREVNKLEINDKEVIAVNVPGTEWAELNYLTNKSMVFFAPETIEKLIKKGELSIAFDKFRVSYILGYSPELTREILENSSVKNITTDEIDLSQPKVSKTKSWLMNLIR